MAVPGKAESFIRFAEFELNLCTGELRTNGHKVYLQEKPFQILSLLLERPGQLVTREELEKKLWTSDTFVDFDQSLNKAVNRLREALNDSSEEPRFIETLPRRGYRFVAQVNDSRTNSPSAPVEPLAPGVPDSPVKRRHRALSANAILLGLGLFGGITFIAWLVPAPAGPTILQVRPITHDGRPKGAYAALATDGARIYFEEIVAGKELVAQVSSSGGETAVNSLPIKGTPADISPDGAQLLFIAEMPSGFQVWIQPLPVGSPRRVGDLQGNDAGWAPDGEHFVFSDDTGVFWAKSDGTEVRKIATTGTAAWPRVSPDGRRVRFTAPDSKGSSARSLWEVGSDGTGLRPLLPGWSRSADDCCGRWTHDGRYYVFQSGRGGSSNLWVLQERRGWLDRRAIDPVQLTRGPLEFFLPQPSREGNQIFAIGQQLRSELMRYELNSRVFLPYLGGISATEVDISRDGQWATYVAYPEGALWRCRIDGSERMQLTNAPMQVMNPRWSPSGEGIAFTAFQPGAPFSVYLAPAAGGSVRRILLDDTANPSWSPDGNSIVFNHFSPGKQADHPDLVRIEILDLTSQSTTVVPDSDGMYVAGWSPAGRYLLGKTSDHHQALLFDMKTLHWSRVAEAEMLTNVRWSRSGDFAYFEATSEENGAVLMRVRIADRKVEHVMDFRDIRRPLIQLSAAWTGLTDDDSPLVQRDIGIQEVYALEWRLP